MLSLLFCFIFHTKLKRSMSNSIRLFPVRTEMAFSPTLTPPLSIIHISCPKKLTPTGFFTNWLYRKHSYTECKRQTPTLKDSFEKFRYNFFKRCFKFMIWVSSARTVFGIIFRLIFIKIWCWDFNILDKAYTMMWSAGIKLYRNVK